MTAEKYTETMHHSLIKIVLVFALLSCVACSSGGASSGIGEPTGTQGGVSGATGTGGSSGSTGDTGSPSGTSSHFSFTTSFGQNAVGSRVSSTSQFKNFGGVMSQGSTAQGSVYTSHSSVRALSQTRLQNAGGSQP